MAAILRAINPASPVAQDTVLLQNWVTKRERAAFDELVRRHVDLVYSTALRQLNGDTHLAEDVTQAVFLILSNKAGTIRGGGALPAWLHRTTRYATANARRTRARRIRHENRAATERPEATMPEPTRDRDPLFSLLDEAIESLSERDRAVIIHRYLQGKDVATVATALRISPQATQKRLERAVVRLRRIFVQKGATGVTMASVTAVMGGAAVHGAPPTLVSAIAGLGTVGKSAVVGASVTSIANGAMKTMMWIKIKLMIATALVVAVVGTGAGVVGQTFFNRQIEASPPSAPMAPVSNETVAPVGIQSSGLTEAAAPVTVHVSGVTPREALAAISKQIGIKIPIWPDSAWDPRYRSFNNPIPRVTLNMDNQPFWAVMHEFCIQAKARLQQVGGGEMFSVCEGYDNEGSAPVYITSTHYVSLTNLNRTNSVQFGRTATVSESRATDLVIWIDPRINVIKTSNAVWVTKAIDQDGTSIVVPHDSNWDVNYSGSSFSRHEMHLNIPFNYDWTKSKRLTQLAGHGRVLVASKVETIEIPDMSSAKGTEKSASGLKLVVSDITLEPRQLQYKLAIHRGPTISEERWRDITEQAWNRIELIAADGTIISQGGGGSGRTDTIEVQGSCSAGQDFALPIKLVWPIVTASEPLDLPFEFHDLPLP